MNSALISRLAIAPMIDWTYTHFRVFMRLLAPEALLYTEMQTVGAILNNPEKALYHHPIEHPLALQLGGVDARALEACARMAEQKGFVEVNLNLGCPSDRVQAGKFGVCLMKEPHLVADAMRAMKKVVNIPITAKIRIGVDEQDSFAFFKCFVDTLLEAGCDKLIVHARKAWLTGLNPKQNRNIPPLCYDYVYNIKPMCRNIPVVMNGQILTIQEVMDHLQKVDAVMIGRLAYQNPYEIAKIHHTLYPKTSLAKRSEILHQYVDYAKKALEREGRFSMILKPLQNLAHGLAHSKCWKAKLMSIQETKNATEMAELYPLMQELE